MAIGTPVSVGTVQNKIAEAATVLTTTAAAPAGSLIVVGVAFDADGVIGSVADSAGNTYSLAAGAAGGVTNTTAEAAVYYAQNAAALGSGGTITVNWSTQPAAKAVSALCATGIAASGALDQTGTGTGSSTTPTATTAGATAQAEELTIGLVALEIHNAAAFTQDSSPAYATPPAKTGTTGGADDSNITIAGGYFIESATGTKTYNPTLGFARDWAAIVCTFKAALSEAVGTSAGAATVSGVGQAEVGAAGSSAGTGAAAGVGASTAGATGDAQGLAGAAGEGAAISGSTGIASGSAQALGDGSANAGSSGAAFGVAGVSGVGAAVAGATGASTGLAQVIGIGEISILASQPGGAVLGNAPRGAAVTASRGATAALGDTGAHAA